MVTMGIYTSFAALLDYPMADLPCRLDRCLAGVGASKAVASTESLAVAAPAAALLRFRAEIGRLGLTRLEELYSASFDMDPGCALYAGPHLFGETARRSAFMAGLAEEYRKAGFDEAVSDLPDYLPTMLRFVDRPDAANGSRRTLLDEAIVPAARAIADALERRGDPYAHAMRALLAVLGAELSAVAGHREGARP